MFKFLVIFGWCILLLGCGSDKIIHDSQAKGKGVKRTSSEYTWMTMDLPWRGTIDLPFVGNEHVKESEEAEIKLSQNSSYTLYLSLGSSEYQVYNVVAIRSDGNVIAAYKDPDNFQTYQRKFKVSPTEIAALTEVLIKNQAGQLPASSVNTDGESYVQGGFTLISGRLIRRSYFSDSWLKSFKNICEFINSNILRFVPAEQNNGFIAVRESILDIDQESTKAIRGLLVDK